MFIVKEILYPAFIASVVIFSSPIVWGVSELNKQEQDSIEEIECTQASAEEKPNYKIESWEAALTQQGTIKLNKQGFISVAKVKKLRKAENVILVDIRDAEAFSTQHIPQSINIKAKQLVSKGFLKNKSVVLINEGFSVAKMEKIHKKLQTEGFNQVSILDGGLNAWLQTGEKLKGTGLAARRINSVTPQQFFLERKYTNLIVLDMSEYQDSQTTIKQLLQKGLVKKSGHNSAEENRVLIVTELGEGYEKIQKAVSELAWQSVFFLQGGKKAYKIYLASQQAIWNRSTEKQGKVNKCGRRNR